MEPLSVIFLGTSRTTWTGSLWNPPPRWPLKIQTSLNMWRVQTILVADAAPVCFRLHPYACIFHVSAFFFPDVFNYSGQLKSKPCWTKTTLDEGLLYLNFNQGKEKIWRGKLNNGNLRTLYTSPYRLWMGDEVKEDEMVEACSSYGKSDKWIDIR